MKTHEVDPRWHKQYYLIGREKNRVVQGVRHAKVFYADIHRGFGRVDRIAFGTSTSAASTSTATIDAFIHPGFDYDCSYFHGLITLPITKCRGRFRLILGTLS